MAARAHPECALSISKKIDELRLEVMKALVSHHNVPPEYTDMRLCRDVYHCTPSELDEQDYERVLFHIVCMNEEAVVEEVRANAVHKHSGTRNIGRINSRRR